MAEKHIEPGIVTPEEVLLRWPLEPVPRHLIPDEAHQHAVEFKKQSAATSEQIDQLMLQHNDGLDLESYFQKRLEAAELDWEDGPSKAEAGPTAPRLK
jgi:hypothetical protein